MKKFSVLLLLPDSIAENYGQETYLDHVLAKSVKGAVKSAQRKAAKMSSIAAAADFYPLAVFSGHLEDLLCVGGGQ